MNWLKKLFTISKYNLTISETEIQNWIEKKDIIKLANAVSNKNYKIRTSAAEALIKFHDKQAVSILIKTIPNRDFNISKKAVEILGYIGDNRAVDPLIQAFKSQHLRVRREIVIALGNICDKRGIKLLIKALNDPDEEIRDNAAFALAMLGDLHAFEPLCLFVIDAYDSKKVEAMDALMNLNDKRAIIPITIALTAENKYEYQEAYKVRKKAAEVLAHFGIEYWLSIFKGDDEDFIRFAESKDNFALELLFNTIEGDHKNNKIGIINVLENLGIKFWEALQSINKNDLRRFGESNNYAAIRIFTKLLGSGKGETRLQAAKILGGMGEELWVSVIKGKYEDFDNLAKTKNMLAYEPLLYTLNNSDWFMRCQAADALGKLGDKRAVEPLIEALSDYDDRVKDNAASSLEELGDKRAIEHLYKVVSYHCHTNLTVARALIGLGESLKVIPKLVPLIKDWENGAYALSALVKNFNWKPRTISENVYMNIASKNGNNLREIWDDVKKVLLIDVKSNNYETIQYALFSFISIGIQEIIPILINTLNNYGTKTTAEAYLNCGNIELSNAAKSWAKINGYTITYTGGISPVTWGGW
jgi:HEAT repeat protein